MNFTLYYLEAVLKGLNGEWKLTQALQAPLWWVNLFTEQKE